MISTLFELGCLRKALTDATASWYSSALISLVVSPSNESLSTRLLVANNIGTKGQMQAEKLRERQSLIGLASKYSFR